MAAEKSLHRKIQLVLEQAQSSTATKLADLAGEILNKKFPNFQTLQYNEAKDTFLWRPSARVIRRVVNLCYQLGLLDDGGRLTNHGRQAVRKTQFDSVLSEQVRRILAKNSISIGTLNEAIEASLRKNPPVLPTSKNLWATLSPSVKAGEFSRFLTLLSHCGAAESSQAKVYLRIETK